MWLLASTWIPTHRAYPRFAFSQWETALLCNDVSHWLGGADSRFAPSHWETALLCNDVSHWLGTNLESDLYTCFNWTLISGDRSGSSYYTVCENICCSYKKYWWYIVKTMYSKFAHLPKFEWKNLFQKGPIFTCDFPLEIKPLWNLVVSWVVACDSFANMQ